MVPNRAQPRWILEGLAVLEESEHTSGGRNRSSIFDMYLRADTLDHRIAGLDQMSHSVHRWPQGNLWYLYGSRFLTWIADVYGDDALRAVSHDYGQQIIPWGINRSMRRATGRTYEELFEGWTAYLEQHYGEQMRQVEALGIREGVRLTHHGQTNSSPRFVPRAAMKTKAREELLYYRDDAHSRSGFYRLAARRHEDRARIGRDLGGSHRLARRGVVRRRRQDRFQLGRHHQENLRAITSSFFSIPGWSRKADTSPSESGSPKESAHKSRT